MAFKRVHRLMTGSVANGATKEDSWKSDSEYTLQEVIITPRGNTPLTNVQFYADVNGIPIYRPDVPADLFDPLNPNRIEIHIPLTKGASFNYKLTNNSGAAETYDISLELETTVWPPQ